MKALIVLSAAAIVLAGCSGSSDYIAPAAVVTPPPPVASKVSFTTFVNDAAAQDADATPLDVNADTLLFDAEDDPDAFTALIETS